ncbi:MAG: endonuclease III [Legionellales bacterium]|jgi:endonuclease III|nr:endonuclease III [Legionellales bacterium]
MNKSDYQKIFTVLRDENPSPTTELNYTSDFQLLIAVILSAQATDIGVNKATAKLFELVKTPKDMITLGEKGLIEHIKSIGLYKNKAKNVIQTCLILDNKHQGKIPQTREELESLPGVGRKTANVVLNTAFNFPVIAVDTHIFRVANRTGMARGKTTIEIETKLTKKIPKEFLQDAHHWLILHGRYICKARAPICSECKIQSLCKWPKKTKM